MNLKEQITTMEQAEEFKNYIDTLPVEKKVKSIMRKEHNISLLVLVRRIVQTTKLFIEQGQEVVFKYSRR